MAHAREKSFVFCPQAPPHLRDVVSSFVVKHLGDSKYGMELHTLYFSCDILEVIKR